jgi:predicted O-linked N-acetylglucosamine transferase (SPINDLY family)
VESPVRETLKIAKSHHSAGRLAEAEELYREILTDNPEDAETLQMLGTLLSQKGEHEDGRALVERAIRIKPGVAAYHANRGLILLNLGYLELAVDALRRALELEPNFPEALYNLGNALLRRGQVNEAIECYQQALALRSDDATALCNLGAALIEAGRYSEAVGVLRRAVDYRLDYAEAMSNLATALAHENLDEAIELYAKASALRPGATEIVAFHAGALKEAGRLDEAIAVYRKGIESSPDSALHSGLLYALEFHPDCDPRALAGELSRWNAIHARPLAKFIQKHLNHTEANRRMKVGYVSPNFFRQAEAHFVLPLLAGHDRQQVEVHCFSGVRKPDELTELHRQVCDVWHDVARDDDDKLTKRIREVGIDILVDLTMHMGENRLLVFARKPAPVQLTWLAYPGSTGLETIDGRLTDGCIDPPGAEESIYREKTIRLPGCWCCYDPLSDATARPAEQKGAITFGSLSNPCKLNPRTLRLWAQVVRKAADSRMLILSNSERQREQIRRVFEAAEVKSHRVQFVGTCRREEYLRLYDRIDIVLDTLPFNGITTTCDALWMGVPVVTLMGQQPQARAGGSILKTVGMENLVVRAPEEFVATAVKLAGDIPRLVGLRASLRQKLLESPMVDARGFAAGVEVVYRELWRGWCAQFGG